MRNYRLLNFIKNSITVLDQATGKPVGVSGEARFPNAIPISRSESHTLYCLSKFLSFQRDGTAVFCVELLYGLDVFGIDLVLKLRCGSAQVSAIFLIY